MILASRISASRSVLTAKAAKLLSPRSGSPPDSGFTPWHVLSSVAPRPSGSTDLLGELGSPRATVGYTFQIRERVHYGADDIG